MPSRKLQLAAHHAALGACRACPRMIGPVVVPPPVESRVLVVGQAPGPREGALGRPFAWTAGKTLFRWLHTIGPDEDGVRASIYFAAVCRCFPGKGSSGGDRVPAPDEIARCRPFLAREVELLRPELVIPVGRLAIQEILGTKAPLDAIVGTAHHVDVLGHETDVIPLPHPSGASSWFKKEPGVTLLGRALGLIRKHSAWREAVANVMRKAIVVFTLVTVSSTAFAAQNYSFARQPRTLRTTGQRAVAGAVQGIGLTLLGQGRGLGAGLALAGGGVIGRATPGTPRSSLRQILRHPVRTANIAILTNTGVRDQATAAFGVGTLGNITMGDQALAVLFAADGASISAIDALGPRSPTAR